MVDGADRSSWPRQCVTSGYCAGSQMRTYPGRTRAANTGPTPTPLWCPVVGQIVGRRIAGLTRCGVRFTLRPGAQRVALAGLAFDLGHPAGILFCLPGRLDLLLGECQPMTLPP